MSRIDRRRFVQLSGAGMLAAGTGGLAAILASGRAPAYAQGTTVHWLRWSDFVPASDQLLRQKAELTRSALRLAVFDWTHEDWFAALKAGFSPVAETRIDRLENEALARPYFASGPHQRFPNAFAQRTNQQRFDLG